MMQHQDYEIVIGLEVHAQLLTESKLFCGDAASFTNDPNTHVSPVTLAHPGTLPVMNREAIELAVKLGIACHCDIVKQNYFARKNYFYPDLPKGYQVSQHTAPICRNGFVRIRTTEGSREIRLNRIHLEEDAGKSIHDLDPDFSNIDLNRAGVPLVEIVSEPDLRSAEEAFAFLTELRKMVRYLDVCDGNMEEGSMRCDANVSVRKKGDTVLGTKVEVKNLNSIRNVKRAIEFESQRLIDLHSKGQNILQQTRSFDTDAGTTFAIRDKEEADDYRYFPEPDLTPFNLTGSFIEAIEKTIPALQPERIKKYTAMYQLTEYDATVLTEERKTADYFEEIVAHTGNYKAAANWMMGPVKTWMNDSGKEVNVFPLKPAVIAALIRLIEEGKVSFSAASGRIFPILLKYPVKDPLEIAKEENLIQDSNVNNIEPIVDEVIQRLAEKVREYQKGKKGLLALFVGEVMKRSRGKADPKLVNELLTEKLKS